MLKPYKDRQDAGQQLAQFLLSYKKNPDLVIFGLPRGGIPVAYEVSQILNAPLYPLIVRKLGVPWHEELAMGAIASGGGIYLNQNLITEAKITPDDIQKVLQKEQAELARREAMYAKKVPDIVNKIILIIDDGIATGATMLAAINALKTQHPKKIIIAVPVAAADTCDAIKPYVSELICPLKPENFNAVGSWYEVFDQTTDKEVMLALKLN
jgi:predicted phosphoribosyltransferase